MSQLSGRSCVAARSVAFSILVLLSSAPAVRIAEAAAASPTVTAAVGLPTTGAPSATLIDLSTVGYQASEFFLTGNASSYHNAVGPPFTANGQWTIEADATQQPYKTRIQVYRPINPASFNGTVYVEWLNVTNQSDSAADWILSHVEMIRQGAVYVGVTVQLIGVNAARNLEPARYGSAGANLAHPGDSFSYDIFSQAGQAVRDNQGTILGGLALAQLIALGESQSATRLVTYIDALGFLHQEYDGYLVHSRGTNGAALRGNPPGTINAPGPTLIRTDLGVPVFVLQTETDSRATRQPDTSIFVQWEVAGSAHADMYTLGIGQFDTGLDNTAAVRLFQAMLHPTNDPLPGILPPCGLPVNSGPHHWSYQAAIFALENWVADGTPPPSGGPGLTTTGAPTAPLVLDANGNATGGVRSPHVDAPVATIRGTGQPPSNLFCSLFGTDTPFTSEKLATLYPSHGAFVSAWNQSVDDGVAGGFLVAEDAPVLKFSAEASDVGKHVLTALSPLSVWIGLKNSDDQGANFDVRAELLVNDAPIASGLTRCIKGVTRNAAKATEAVVAWDAFTPVTLEDSDVLSMRVSTRIGTNANDSFCGGHASAVGLRLYYDASTRASHFDATIFPAANSDQFLHSDGTACGNAPSAGVTTATTDPIAPVAAAAKCLDSGAVKFSGGNAWQVVDDWTLPPTVP